MHTPGNLSWGLATTHAPSLHENLTKSVSSSAPLPHSLSPTVVHAYLPDWLDFTLIIAHGWRIAFGVAIGSYVLLLLASITTFARMRCAIKAGAADLQSLQPKSGGCFTVETWFFFFVLLNCIGRIVQTSLALGDGLTVHMWYCLDEVCCTLFHAAACTMVYIWMQVTVLIRQHDRPHRAERIVHAIRAVMFAIAALLMSAWIIIFVLWARGGRSSSQSFFYQSASQAWFCLHYAQIIVLNVVVPIVGFRASRSVRELDPGAHAHGRISRCCLALFAGYTCRSSGGILEIAGPSLFASPWLKIVLVEQIGDVVALAAVVAILNRTVGDLRLSISEPLVPASGASRQWARGLFAASGLGTGRAAPDQLCATGQHWASPNGRVFATPPASPFRTSS